MPAVRQSGDLTVRLDDLITGDPDYLVEPVHLAGGEQVGTLRPVNPGEPENVFFDVLATSGERTNEDWVMHHAVLSDPGGNTLAADSPTILGKAHELGLVSGTLWPDEPAWRLKLEFKRSAGFPPEDVVTLKNVSLPGAGGTNNGPVSIMVGGMRLEIVKIGRNPNAANITFELTDRPKGVAVDLVMMTTDDGMEIRKQGSVVDTTWPDLQPSSVSGWGWQRTFPPARKRRTLPSPCRKHGRWSFS